MSSGGDDLRDGTDDLLDPSAGGKFCFGLGWFGPDTGSQLGSRQAMFLQKTFSALISTFFSHKNLVYRNVKA